MNRFRLIALVAFLAAAWCAPFAAAQTQNLTPISGQGQLICPTCTATAIQQFDPLTVKVTDQSGNPVPNAAVTWSVTLGPGCVGYPNSACSGSILTTTTDASGQTSISYIEPFLNIASTSQPFLQSNIVASTNTAALTFYETETAIGSTVSNSTGNQLVFVEIESPSSTPSCPNCPFPGDVLSGTAGATATQQIVGLVYTISGSAVAVVPNVELHLIPNQSAPSAQCATGPGADPGTVLSDVTGAATCSIVFGSSAGYGSFFATVGGVAASPVNGSIGFFQTGNFYINVQPGTPGAVKTFSGNAQTANPGQPLPLPLVALVADTNGNPLGGQQVTWAVSPAGAAVLTNTTTVSDANGQVRTNATLSANAVGAVTITATLNNNHALLASFAETANIQVTGLSKVSGDNQTAIINAGFPSPLIVQLTTSNGVPTAGVPVTFTLTGPGVLSATTATTAANGQAQVSVTATGTTGTITVTGQAGNFAVAFSLNVIPAGPQLTTNSFYNGADFQRGAIGPCSIATIIAPGVAPTLQGTIGTSMLGPLPYLLANDTVTINGSQAPIFNVANVNNQQQITFQIPCGLTAGTANVTVGVGGGSSSIAVSLNPVSPGIFGAQQSNGTYLPVLLRPDGSFVSAQNPARRGETVIAFATGLGPTTPSINTNSLPIPGSTATVQGTVVVGFAGAGIAFQSAQASPDLIGVYEVAFQIPTTAASGNNTFSLGVQPVGSQTVYYSGLGTVPVQ